MVVLVFLQGLSRFECVYWVFTEFLRFHCLLKGLARLLEDFTVCIGWTFGFFSCAGLFYRA